MTGAELVQAILDREASFPPNQRATIDQLSAGFTEALATFGVEPTAETVEAMLAGAAIYLSLVKAHGDTAFTRALYETVVARLHPEAR